MSRWDTEGFLGFFGHAAWLVALVPQLGIEPGTWTVRAWSPNHSENTLYDAVMMDTSHYTFVQTNRMYNTKTEP